ncbi:MAG: glucose 1-dehydrogenase [Cytophagales bacterium]|nr:MAG: glucose 1-dehydrogenase [Cytophagales bacterium]
MRFQNKVCLVTGAGSGIGRATAVAFAREGARVLVADVNGTGGEETVAQITATGGITLFINVNIADRQQVGGMVARAVGEWGQLDCAVNCAGVTGGKSAPTHEYPDDAWAQNVAVNLNGTLFCMQAELTQMLRQGGGAIVNIASAAALKGHPNNIGYCATKHAIVGMTKTAAIEYATRNIRINALCPSAIETPMLMDGRLNLRNNPELREKFTNDQAMKRMGHPDEVADVALWLCSDQSTFITGHAMTVDGGMFA